MLKQNNANILILECLAPVQVSLLKVSVYILVKADKVPSSLQSASKILTRLVEFSLLFSYSSITEVPTCAFLPLTDFKNNCLAL